MRSHLLSLCFGCWLVLLGWTQDTDAVSPSDEESVQKDEQMLRAAGMGTDGPALLEFLRKRSQLEVNQSALAALVRQLGDKTSAVREKAAADIIARGPMVIPLLRQALKDPDEQEIAKGAERCLQLIEGNKRTALPTSVIRLLAARKPAGALEVLLAYLPFADDDNVVEEVRAALTTLAWGEGKPNPLLIAALEDKLPIRRAVAGEALCRAGGLKARGVVAKLLNDAKPTVRLRAAMALADLWEEKAVSTLIALLEEAPPAQASRAENYLINLFGESGPKERLVSDPAARQKCRAAWAAWWLDINQAALLTEFRKRTLTDADRDTVLALIQQLGDEAFEKREKAMADLQMRGTAVMALLRQAMDNPDAEISHRARRCVQHIEKDKDAALPLATIRLVALRKPTGAIDALMAFVPFAEDDAIRTEVQTALLAVATRGGQLDPALAPFLKDRLPQRRAVAAEVLCKAGPGNLLPAVMELLKDDDSDVRLRVALALAGAGEKAGIPVLIDLLTEAPLDQALAAEESLRQLAGGKAPEQQLGNDQAGRQKCREVWGRWWREQGDKVDLAAAGRPRQQGHTLMVLFDVGAVVEISRAGKERWRLEGLMNPLDAKLLPGERLLVTELNGGRVTERNLKNEVLWEKQVNNPLSAQRSPNGKTFIACRGQLLEVDRTGKETVLLNRPKLDIMASQQLRDGQIVCALRTGLCLILDATGKETRSFPIGPVVYNCVEAQPNGRILMAHAVSNCVREYDHDGKTVWQADVLRPSSVMRLPNGNVLVSSYQTGQVVELDRHGKVVWSHKIDSGQPWVARRR